MADHYTISWEPGTRSILVDMDGFWNELVVDRFAADMARVIRQAGGRPFDLIADLSGAGPQPQIVVTLQKDVLDGLARAGLSRFVIAGAGALLTMQVKRAAAPLVPHFTATVAAGRQWLATQRDGQHADADTSSTHLPPSTRHAPCDSPGGNAA